MFYYYWASVVSGPLQWALALLVATGTLVRLLLHLFNMHPDFRRSKLCILCLTCCSCNIWTCLCVIHLNLNKSCRLLLLMVISDVSALLIDDNETSEWCCWLVVDVGGFCSWKRKWYRRCVVMCCASNLTSSSRRKAFQTWPSTSSWKPVFPSYDECARPTTTGLPGMMSSCAWMCWIDQSDLPQLVQVGLHLDDEKEHYEDCYVR